jgi:multicomponent Na+:H+ antiporter subunit G
MQEWITGALLITGGLFAFVAALGILRLPDAIIRMHAATKAGTLGCGLIFAAVAVDRLETGTTLRAGAAIVFLLLTAPVAAHLIGRAAYKSGIQLWEKTWVDHLGDQYAERTVESKSEPEPAKEPS